MFGTPAVEQRIQGNGGWSEGDAKFSGENPPSGAVITYYQKARHVIGRMKLEILDSAGNVVDEIPGAYKDIDSVMANQTDLVEVLHTLKQVVCVKG